MDKKNRRQRLFELFNEIGIINQLASTEFNRRLPDGLHVSHFSVINHLCRLGDGRTPVQIADAFQVTKPTMTHTLAKLATKGFIEIRANPDDGRSKQVFLTKHGRAFHQQAIASVDPVLDALDKRLEATELAKILPGLRTLREYLDKSRSD